MTLENTPREKDSEADVLTRNPAPVAVMYAHLISDRQYIHTYDMPTLTSVINLSGAVIEASLNR